MNFAKLLRAPFLQSTSGRLLLWIGSGILNRRYKHLKINTKHWKKVENAKTSLLTKTFIMLLKREQENNLLGYNLKLDDQVGKSICFKMFSVLKGKLMPC